MPLFRTRGFAHTFRVPAWDFEMRKKARRYWEGRRFKLDKQGTETITGNRGSLWLNLIAMDMRKVRGTLRISPTGPNEITATLEINTTFQTVTEWEEEFWRFELLTFHSYLLQDDLQEAAWERFLQMKRRATFYQILTHHAGGGQVPWTSPELQANRDAQDPWWVLVILGIGMVALALWLVISPSASKDISQLELFEIAFGKSAAPILLSIAGLWLAYDGVKKYFRFRHKKNGDDNAAN
jgi:hypothetical protein